MNQLKNQDSDVTIKKRLFGSGGVNILKNPPDYQLYRSQDARSHNMIESMTPVHDKHQHRDELKYLIDESGVDRFSESVLDTSNLSQMHFIARRCSELDTIGTQGIKELMNIDLTEPIELDPSTYFKMAEVDLKESCSLPPLISSPGQNQKICINSESKTKDAHRRNPTSSFRRRLDKSQPFKGRPDD